MTELKVHHLNCGSMCPLGSHLFPRFFPQEIVCHCLLIEVGQRLVLVDTGLGVQDLQNLKKLGPLTYLLNPVPDLSLTAFEQVKSLGFSPTDVTDLIPTHLDLDHAGGLRDFPHARVHIAKDELRAAQARIRFNDKNRYRPHQWSSATRWQEYDPTQGEMWNGFDCVRSLPGLPPEILLVRLPGHTPGHFGVAVKTNDRWLLHGGDAYYDHKELESREQPPLGLRIFQRIVHTDFQKALSTQRKLRALKKDPSLEVFCSHDAVELQNLKGRAAKS